MSKKVSDVEDIEVSRTRVVENKKSCFFILFFFLFFFLFF
jgi:hypothetical protein